MIIRLIRSSAAALLILVSCSGATAPKDGLHSQGGETLEVHQIFSGFGEINREYSPKSPKYPDAVLVLAREASELVQIVQTQFGKWEIYSETMVLALGKPGLLIIKDCRKQEVAVPKWVGVARERFEGEVVNALADGGESDHGVRWFLALVHKGTHAPIHLRIAGASVKDKTLQVRIEGDPQMVRLDPESSNTMLKFVVVGIHYTRDPRSLWPEKVEVYTNGKHGYPRVPLRVRLGQDFLKENQPVIGN